jgi:hypothetical protein
MSIASIIALNRNLEGSRKRREEAFSTPDNTYKKENLSSEEILKIEVSQKEHEKEHGKTAEEGVEIKKARMPKEKWEQYEQQEKQLYSSCLDLEKQMNTISKLEPRTSIPETVLLTFKDGHFEIDGLDTAITMVNKKIEECEIKFKSTEHVPIKSEKEIILLGLSFNKNSIKKAKLENEIRQADIREAKQDLESNEFYLSEFQKFNKESTQKSIEDCLKEIQKNNIDFSAEKMTVKDFFDKATYPLLLQQDTYNQQRCNIFDSGYTTLENEQLFRGQYENAPRFVKALAGRQYFKKS